MVAGDGNGSLRSASQAGVRPATAAWHTRTRTPCSAWLGVVAWTPVMGLLSSFYRRDRPREIVLRKAERERIGVGVPTVLPG